MDYFKKISVKTVPQTIIDSPIRIQEVAILQDSVDMNILGRVKFVNQSSNNVIAVFLDLEAKDISGEPILLENPTFIYQDMVVFPGELYGNEIAINLPDAVRKFTVSINRVVFEDGSVWKATDARTCSPLPLEQMELPKENADRIRSELTEIIPNVEYINYYYQENDTAWLCSCGRVNSIEEETCPLCDCFRSPQEQILTKDKFHSFCDTINDIVRKEKEKEKEEKREKKEEEDRRKEEEWKQLQEERKQRQEIEEKERLQQIEEDRKRSQRNKRIASIGLALLVIILVAISIYQFYWKPTNRYNEALTLMDNDRYKEAIDIFDKLGRFKDSNEQLVQAQQYYDAENLIEEGQFKSAINTFEELGDYRDAENRVEETTQIYLNGNEEKIKIGKIRCFTSTIIGTIVGIGDETITIENASETGYMISLSKAENYADSLSVGMNVIVNLSDQSSNEYGVFKAKEIFKTEYDLWNTIPGKTKLAKATACAELYANSIAIYAEGAKNVKLLPLDIPKTNNFKFTCYLDADDDESRRTIVVDLDSSVYITSSTFFDVEIEIQDKDSNIDYVSSDTSSFSSSSSTSSSSSSSITHTCQVSGCNNTATHSITGLNGTQEYYCSKHYSQLGDMMDMIMGD